MAAVPSVGMQCWGWCLAGAAGRRVMDDAWLAVSEW